MLNKLLDNIDANCNNIDKDFIIKAYNFAYEAHKDQKRESGELYIIHPVEVAIILAKMGLDTNTIAAGLLHDVVEDTKNSYDDIVREFGKEVADLVDGVTKLGKIQYKTKEEQQADNVRKMLVAMAKDVRVILIKLADRLHNMRTLKYMPIEKRKEKAKETFDIYAPLAHRLGMSKIKWELEDLAFRYTNPSEYYDLVRKISEKRVEREAYILRIVKELKETLTNAGIETDIEGRPKHFYSIYRKMINKNKTIDQIYDLTAIRILVPTVKDCYAVLGIAHTIYKPMPGRFKDYIAMPKPNMYQSLHSTVIGPQGKPFEIQIRTFDMHKTAEYGIAAHWKYKEGKSGDEKPDFNISWLREILEWQREASDPAEFMEGFKIELFSDEVFVFTPQGDVINLPGGATPIDFAYRIHTDIGNSCIGAKVSGKMVPLDYSLKTGEIVEVLTSSVAKGPSIDWLNIAKSNQAKSKIRAWFKKAKREENIYKGRELLEKETKKQGYNFGEIAKGDVFEQILKKYNFNNIEDLYAEVGTGSLAASMLVTRLKEQYIKAKNNDIISLKNPETLSKLISKNAEFKENEFKSNLNNGIIVKGMNNLLVRFAKCCNPVPGDEIVGYVTKGRGVSIHRKDCKNVSQLENCSESKMLEVSWGSNNAGKQNYEAEVQLRADDRDGLLSEIMELISETQTHLSAIDAKTAKNSVAVINLKIRVADITKLKELMKELKRLKGVREVYRTKN